MAIVTPLRRTAIIVRDMERSLRFYRKVLKLDIWHQGEVGPDNVAMHALLGAPPGTVRYVILQSGKVEWGMVGLFELQDPPAPELSGRAAHRARRGEACLVFHTPDVRRIHRGAKSMGLEVLCAPTRLVLPAHGLESLEMTIRDPNGVLLNFIQNIRGGLGPQNLFPGIKRAANSGKKTAVVQKNKAPRSKPVSTLKTK